MSELNRRTLLGGALAGAGVLALPEAAHAASTGRSTGLVRAGRPRLSSGVASGDVTTDGATVWARADRPGRLLATVTGPGRSRHRIPGPVATEATDFTAKLDLRHLAPGREYGVSLTFEGADGDLGEQAELRFRTAAHHPAATSFVWTGDTCGQGWGINPDLGGLTAYAGMHATRPDFFLHCGDTIYADGPISERVTEPDGQVWRNIVTPEVSKVAESLAEFRGRHRYTMLDENVRSMYADVPVLAQWDDHETHNNWYPGQILTDDRYTERRVDVLARRARQAWWEYQPISNRLSAGRGADPNRPGRIYRKVAYGAHLDVFCLDMRSFKDPNTPGLEKERTHILGAEQTDWLIREVSRSLATWKVIAADLPLGLVVPDGPVNEESLSNRDPGAPLGKELELAAVLSAFKRAGVRNVVWLTADVHYCAAHHYDPARAAFADFDPFWEFVAGPIAAGTFGPNQLDATFGPRVDFARAADYPNQSPRGGNQFFGHVDIDRDGTFVVTLRKADGTVLYARTLEPQRR
ncbi:MAG TPA: alkaline phosphatase D family protein [Intrasporangium sp.]|uniref:alkaline phosphatase D family protein n=1 Tax=Intrasporangium sp. TaxID=1925024 RepID=UPI002D7A10F4|nr:alkaline phosphatase D family protein [Intrasporangium sp.]HET7397953.1 alkaline phosphatase D family protein [Intrasporangium sp.]